MRTLFVKMALAAVAVSCLLYQPAQAWTVDVKPDNNPLGLGRPLIEVESDGEEWTNIRSATRQLQLRVNVDVGTGWRVMTVWMKLPNADFCESGATPEGCDLIFGGKTKHFSDTVTHDFSTDHIGGIEAQAIVDKCNADNYQGNRDRDFEGFNVSVGIKAYVLRRSEANDFSEPNQGRTTYAYTTVPVTIRCLAPPQKIEALKPVSVDLRVKQKGETCPKDTEVTASIDYEHEATARFQVIHNGNASNVIEADTRQVTLAGKTWHRIDYVKKYKLDPGKHRFKIKVIGGGHSKKETVTVDCPPFQAKSMWLTLKTENQSTCPKEVDATVRINGNRPGSVLTKVKNQAGVVMAIESIKVEREGDQYVGRLTKTFNMTAIDTMLIAEDANDSSHNSGWQPLKIECLEALSGELSSRRHPYQWRRRSPLRARMRPRQVVAAQSRGDGQQDRRRQGGLRREQ